jgi:hypothetical protein
MIYESDVVKKGLIGQPYDKDFDRLQLSVGKRNSVLVMARQKCWNVSALQVIHPQCSCVLSVRRGPRSNLWRLDWTLTI